jgi:hypothetical protein
MVLSIGFSPAAVVRTSRLEEVRPTKGGAKASVLATARAIKREENFMVGQMNKTDEKVWFF